KHFVSLKVLSADASATSENDTIRHLKTRQKQNLRNLGVEYIVKVFNNFRIEDPNGTHACAMTELLRQSQEVQMDIEELYPDDRIPFGIRKKMIVQITRWISYFHNVESYMEVRSFFKTQPP
ncbi:hypothetical protein BDQ12DRAFT_618555, partial [Crucibulum laeve]